MAKVLSVKSRPYNPEATIELLRRHPHFTLARYSLRKTSRGLQCFVEPQKLKKAFGKGIYSFIAAGEKREQYDRTRDPEVDGAMLVQTLATMRHRSHPKSLQARKVLKFLNARKRKDHLPKDLVYLLLGLHLNALDFKRQTQGEDSFQTATEYLLTSLFSTTAPYREFSAGFRQLRSDLYQNIATGLSYVEKLVSDHGEAPNFRYFSPSLADTILSRCNCPSLKKNLIAEKEGKLWIHSLDTASATEGEIQDQHEQRAQTFRTEIQRQLGLSPSFYFYETLMGGHDSTATASFVREVRKQLEPAALAARFSTIRNAQPTARETRRLAKISRFVDRLLKNIQLEMGSPAEGESPNSRYEEYLGHLLIRFFERTPAAIREKVLTPQALAAEFVAALLKDKETNALSILRAYAAETYTFKAEPGTFFTYQDHLDGYYLVEAIQKQPGFEGFVEATLAQLKMLPVSGTQDEGLLLHTLQNYIGHYWIKLMEKATGKLWPDGPSTEETKALPLSRVLSAFTGNRNLRQAVAECATNIEKTLTLFSENQISDWNGAFLKIGFRPIPASASPQVHHQELQDQQDCLQFLKKKFDQDPLAVTTFFDQEIFGHIFMNTLTVDANNRFVFQAGTWKIDTFFGEYFSRLSPTAKQTKATIEKYLGNICEKSILMQQENNEYEFTSEDLNPALTHYGNHPHETNGFLATNGFSLRQFFPQRYPLIAREDMVAANPKEVEALYEKAQKDGLTIVASSHCHTTASPEASLQDRLTILSQRLPELIFSVPEARMRFYAKSTLEAEPTWVVALNDSF